MYSLSTEQANIIFYISHHCDLLRYSIQHHSVHEVPPRREGAAYENCREGEHYSLQ